MSTEQTTSTTEDESSSIRVLHVDDDPDFADMAASFIEREDASVTVETATSADEGLERLVDDVDCIVSDYDMPRTDGIEFLETVRDEYPDLPFILFTGKGSEEVASEAISAGVTDYLQKSTGTDHYALLCNRIKNAVERYRVDQRLQRARRHFRRVFEQSNDAIMIVDPFEEEIRDVNPRACEMLGYDREELLSLSPEQIHPHEMDRFRKFVDTVSREGTGWTEDLSCLRKDGSRLRVRVSASMIELDDRPHMLANIHDITQQKEHQEGLELFRTLLDNSTDGIYVIDPDTGEFVDVNKTACQRLGYTRSELLSMSVPDIDANGMVDDWDEGLERFLEADRVSTGAAHERKDGTTYPVEIRAKLVTVDEEEYVVATVRDVSDREERARKIEELHGAAQEALQAEMDTEVAETVVDAMSRILDMPLTAVWLHDERENVLRPVAWTDEAAEAVGEMPEFAPGEGLAWEAFETGHTRHYDDVSTAAERYNDDTPMRSEILLPIGDHGLVTVGSTDPGAFDDVDVSLSETFVTHVETALNGIERETKLQRECDRFRALFEMLPEPVTHIQFSEGTPVVHDVNAAFEETFGYERDTVVGESINEVIVSEEQREEAEVIDQEIQCDGVVRRKIRRKTADGTRDFLFMTAPVDEDEDEEFTECFGIAFDITEQKDYERRLERQNDRLEKVASIISHDLRNPLKVAQGRAELLDTECDSDHLDALERAHGRMDALIEDILTLAREGGAPTDLDAVDLAEFTEECWRNVATETATVVAETDRTVRAEESRLRHAFENLMRNAVEHGGEDVTVTVGDLPDGFYVADDGSGIPEDEREEVFEVGYSTDSDGTGFGLSIVKEIVEAHDWDIQVTESAEGGARFDVTGVEFAE